MKKVDFSELKGMIITSIANIYQGSNCVTFTCSLGDKYHMYHDQSSYEEVWLEEIHGDIEGLIGEKILSATENQDSHSYTFYHIGTIKGTVTLRWVGNGGYYYATEVGLYKK